MICTSCQFFNTTRKRVWHGEIWWDGGFRGCTFSTRFNHFEDPSFPRQVEREIHATLSCPLKNRSRKVASCLLAPTSRNQLTLSTSEGKLAVANLFAAKKRFPLLKAPFQKWNKKRIIKQKKKEKKLLQKKICDYKKGKKPPNENRNLANQFHGKIAQLLPKTHFATKLQSGLCW